MITDEIYLKNTWDKVLDNIRNSGIIPDHTFEYIKGDLISLDENMATIRVPLFINHNIMSEYIHVFEDGFEELLGKRLIIRLIQKTELDEQMERLRYKNNFLPIDLDHDQRFDNFVVGKSNHLAQLAAMKCSENPGIYNPLMIYGDSGLGKTHLLNAIGNRVKELYSDRKVGLINSDDFVEGVYKSSTENRFAEFKNTLSDIDVLLVDDIQFIAGKPKTQELFFSVFNEFINNRKQICITCDRIPDEIKGIDNRMLTRFSEGLNINIEAPEYETALSIAKLEIANSNEERKYGLDDVDEDVLDFLASNFSSNIRELKGAVKRLLFYSINFGSDEDRGKITLKLCIEAFKDQIRVDDKGPDISLIRRRVCDYYNISKQQIISKTRTKDVSNARQICMYLCRKHTDATYEEIGRELGGRDHSTVLMACESVDRKLKKDPLLVQAINEIEETIKQ